jgi:hypothetical protein
MPLPFREDDDPGRPGLVAILRIVPESGHRAWAGALLVVNRIGEPTELIHLRMAVPASSVCAGRLSDHASALLLRHLLDRCGSVPDHVYYRSQEIEEAVMRERIQFHVPVTPVAEAGDEIAADAARRLEQAMIVIATEGAHS